MADKMLFKPSRTLIPKELVYKLKNNQDNNEIHISDEGYTWIFDGCKIMIWNESGLKRMRDNYYYELPLDDNEIYKLLFNICEYNKQVCVAVVLNGDLFRYWSNIKYGNKFIQLTLNLSTKNITNLCKIDHTKYLCTTSDYSIIYVEICESQIIYTNISTKNFFPNIINTILSPFSRRSVCPSNTIPYQIVYCERLNFLVFYTSKTLKLVAFEKTNQNIYFKNEVVVNNTNFIDSIYEYLPECKEFSINEIEYVYICTVNDILYLIIHGISHVKHVHLYFLNSISINSNLTYTINTYCLIEQPSLDKVEKGIVKHFPISFLIILLDNRFYSYDLNLKLINRLNEPDINSSVVEIEYCYKIQHLIILYNDVQIYYMSTKFEEYSTHSRLSAFTSVEQSTCITSDNKLYNPLNWTYSDISGHFSTAFNKYCNNQKDLGILMVAGHIFKDDLCDAIHNVIKNVETSSFLESDITKSTWRKFNKISDTVTNLLDFIKESKLLTNFINVSFGVVTFDPIIYDVINCIEKINIHRLVYKLSNTSGIFKQCFVMNDKFIPTIDDVILMLSNILNTLTYSLNKSYSKKDDFINISTFLSSFVSIFESTKDKLKYILNDELKLNQLLEYSISIVITERVLSLLIETIIFCLDYSLIDEEIIAHLNTFELFTRILDVIICLNWYIKSNILQFEHVLRVIITKIEQNHCLICINLCIKFVQFDEFIRLCIAHNRMDEIKIYKSKWSEHDFEKILHSYYIKNQLWKLLLEEVNDDNIDDIFNIVPQLSWVYFVNTNDDVNANNSLKYLASIEKNLFFKKTYACISRILEHINYSEYDSEIGYILDHIKYQQDSAKNISNISTINFMPLDQILFHKLFQSTSPIDLEVIIEAFELISKANENIQESIIVVWCAIVLADPYLKLCDNVIESTCHKLSFVYSCFSNITSRFKKKFIPDSLTQDIINYLNEHLKNPKSQIFYDRLCSVIEICHDKFIIN